MVGWICGRGHKWTASIEKRVTRNQGCPYCSGRVAIPGETDIATTNPELMFMWDYDKMLRRKYFQKILKHIQASKHGGDAKTTIHGRPMQHIL